MLLMLITAITLPWLPGVFSTEALILRLSNVRRVYGDEIRGSLNVRYRGKWGNICSFTFHISEARVACRQLGYLGGDYGYYFINVWQEGLFERVSCNSDESRLDECRLYGGPFRCYISGVVELRCTINPELKGLLNATLLGSTGKMGILEVTSKDGRKAAVCFDSPQNNTSIAKTVCGQMGYSGMQTTLATHQDSYKGNNFVSVFCNGIQPTLASCSMTAITNCPSTNILGLACKLNMTTQQRFDLRLSPNDSSPNDGTVEVYQYGRWGVICDTGWDMKAAQVVCRQLGFRHAISATKDAQFGQGTGIVFWNNIKCSGEELSIYECKYDVAFEKGTCHSWNASGVVCSSERLPSFDILCSDMGGNLTIPVGFSFVRSPGYPNLFSYSSHTNCSCVSTRVIYTELAAYFHEKIFSQTHVELLNFDWSSGPFEFPGDPLSALPTRIFTLSFESGNSMGKGKFKIGMFASEAVSFTCSKTVGLPTTMTIPTSTLPTTGAVSLNLSSGEAKTNPKTGSDGAVGGVIGSLIIMALAAIIGVALWKKGILHFGKRDKTESDAAPTQGEAATPTVIYVNLPNRQATVNEPIYVNSAFVADILSEETAERSENLGPVESPYADIGYQHSRTVKQEVTDDSVACSEGEQEDNVDNDNAGESPYAQLDQVNRSSEYLDFRQLRAEQLRPI